MICFPQALLSARYLVAELGQRATLLGENRGVLHGIDNRVPHGLQHAMAYAMEYPMENDTPMVYHRPWDTPSTAQWKSMAHLMNRPMRQPMGAS